MGLLGASAAAKKAAKVAKQVAGEWKKLGQTEYTWFQPFMQAGTETLGAQMSMLANPVNTQQSLATYYASPEYAMQEEQEQYAAETSAADPYSGMGGSATGNYLGSQSTQLGQQYLQSQAKGRQQQFTNLGGISKMGLSASGTMGNLATKDMQGVASAARMGSEAQMQAENSRARGISSLIGMGIGGALKGFGSSAGTKAAGGTGLWDSIESGASSMWGGIESAAHSAMRIL